MPFYMMVLWFWFWVGPALLSTMLSVFRERRRAVYVRSRLAKKPGKLPPATVIVPVKGEDEGLKENLAALASLDYPDYELLIVAHSAQDIPKGVLPVRARVVLAQGDDPDTSEKVRNLAAAVHAARHRSELFAFADSDERVPRGWLQALITPLAEESVGACTGYRWFVPQPGTFWSLGRAVWDAMTTGLMGPGDNQFAWGGAIAIRKETFIQAGVLKRWKDAITDDYRLADAVHAAGLAVAYAPGALVPTPEHISARRMLAWMRRQMMLTRAYHPRLWWAALVAHIFYCGAMVASLAAACLGIGVGWWTLAAQLVPGMIVGGHRAAMARLALPEYAAWFRRYGWVHTVGNPLGTWLWLTALLSSAFGSTIEWRGYRYSLKKPARADRV